MFNVSGICICFRREIFSIFKHLNKIVEFVCFDFNAAQDWSQLLHTLVEANPSEWISQLQVLTPVTADSFSTGDPLCLHEELFKFEFCERFCVMSWKKTELNALVHQQC